MAGGSGGGNDNRARRDALQPATIKQLLEASGGDDQLTVNGVGLQQVTVVARLYDVVTQVTMMSMRLDDGSGTIDVVMLLPPDEANNASARDVALARRQRLRDGAWARIVGQVRVQSGHRKLEAFMVRALDNHAEIVYHRLDVVRVFLAQTQPRKPRVSPTAATGVDGLLGNSTGTSGGTAQLGADGLMLDPAQRSVLDYARQRCEASKNSGVDTSISLEDVARDVPSVGNVQYAKQILENLASDGHVFTTIDEDHYAYCVV